MIGSCSYMGHPHLLSESTTFPGTFLRVYEVREFEDQSFFDFDDENPLFLNKDIMEVPSSVPDLIVTSPLENMGIARANALVNFARAANQDYVSAARLRSDGRMYETVSHPFQGLVVMRVVPRLFRDISKII